MEINILESPPFYRFFLGRNVDQLCYLKCGPFRLENCPEFSRLFLCGQRYRLEDTKSNALNISDFRTQVHDRIFFWE